VTSCRKTSRGVTDGVRGEGGDRIRGKRRVNIGRFRERNRIRMCRKTLTTGSFYFLQDSAQYLVCGHCALLYLRRIEKFRMYSTGYSI
jgi:hypothetical protein